MRLVSLQEHVVNNTKQNDVLRKFIDTRFRVGIRKRTSPIDKIVLHWTGGDNPPTQVFRTLYSRNISVHYVIGKDGAIWHSHDPAHWVCSHAGYVNDSSIGIEVVNPALSTKRITDRALVRDRLHDRNIAYYDFLDSQKLAIKELVLSLLDMFPTIRRCVPTNADGSVVSKAMPESELRRFGGIIGHYHVTSHKADPGAHIIRDVANWIAEV